MKKVILTKKISDENMKILSDKAEIISVPEGDIDMLRHEIKDAHAILLSTAFKLDREMIQLAKNLKVISRTGVGVDNVDVSEATKNDIMVLNTPGANSISVAEHTLALIMALSKQLVSYDRETRKGNFDIRRSNLAVDLEGKTLGLIGCGRIGRMVADKCRHALEMKVIGYDPFISSEINGIALKDNIEDVFKEADYISIHIPLLDSSRNLVNSKLLDLMKPTAFIINTSRGGIIDEDALEKKLKEKGIKGAALDVFAEEPLIKSSPLLELENLIVTPHSAALTKECSARVAREAVYGIVDYLEGKEPQFVYNKKTK